MTFDEIQNLVTQVVTWLFGSGIGAMLIAQVGSAVKTYCKTKAESKSINATVSSELADIKDKTLGLVKEQLKTSLNTSFAVDVSAQINEKVGEFIGGVKDDLVAVKNQMQALDTLLEDIAKMYAKSRGLTADEKAEIEKHIEEAKACKCEKKAENVVNITFTEETETKTEETEKTSTTPLVY